MLCRYGCKVAMVTDIELGDWSCALMLCFVCLFVCLFLAATPYSAETAAGGQVVAGAGVHAGTQQWSQSQFEFTWGGRGPVHVRALQGENPSGPSGTLPVTSKWLFFCLRHKSLPNTQIRTHIYPLNITPPVHYIWSRPFDALEPPLLIFINPVFKKQLKKSSAADFNYSRLLNYLHSIFLLSPSFVL